MRLVQFELGNGERRVGVVEGSALREVRTPAACANSRWPPSKRGVGLAQQVDSLGLGDQP
jgi:hypothetical protein